MTNLTDLLPAGAGGKQVDFVASGTISNGVTVALNTDGTVTAIASDGNPEALGTPVTVDTSTNTGDLPSVVFDSANNKVVALYADASPYYGKAEVGTVSGTSISFGSAVTFNSGSTQAISSCYDSTSGSIVVFYIDAGNSNYPTAVVGTVSGTSISFGSEQVVTSDTSYFSTIAYDSSQDKVVVAYQNGTNGRGTAKVGTVSGTSISFGSAVEFETGVTDEMRATFDSANSCTVIAYPDTSASSRGTAVVGTVSGTSISFGSPVQFETGQTSNVSIAYDSTNSKVVIAYKDISNSDYGTSIVGTVSGTSISFGTAVVFNSGATKNTSTAYDSNAQKIVIAYEDDANLDYGTLIVGTVSGTSISFSAEQVFDSTDMARTFSCYDSVSKQIIISYSIPSNNYVKAVVFQNESSNYESFIGISDAAISDTATGSVTIKGGISSNVTGLTPNSTYYVQSDGSLSTTASSVLAGKALSSTSINLDYTT